LFYYYHDASDAVLLVAYTNARFLVVAFSERGALGSSSRREDIGASKLKKLIKDDCLNLALYRFLADKPVTAQLQCDGTNRNGKWQHSR
jgi:hypothetical protein